MFIVLVTIGQVTQNSLHAGLDELLMTMMTLKNRSAFPIPPLSLHEFAPRGFASNEKFWIKIDFMVKHGSLRTFNIVALKAAFIVHFDVV